MLIIKWKGIVQKNVSFDPPLKETFHKTNRKPVYKATRQLGMQQT